MMQVGIGTNIPELAVLLGLVERHISLPGVLLLLPLEFTELIYVFTPLNILVIFNLTPPPFFFLSLHYDKSFCFSVIPDQDTVTNYVSDSLLVPLISLGLFLSPSPTSCKGKCYFFILKVNVDGRNPIISKAVQ